MGPVPYEQPAGAAGNGLNNNAPPPLEALIQKITEEQAGMAQQLAEQAARISALEQQQQQHQPQQQPFQRQQQQQQQQQLQQPFQQYQQHHLPPPQQHQSPPQLPPQPGLLGSPQQQLPSQLPPGELWSGPQKDAASFNAISQSLAAKDMAKRWNDEEEALFFILRGGHFVTTVLSASNLAHMTRKIAAPLPNMLHMLLSLSNVDITAFGPPIPAGFSLHPCDATTHFAIFIKVLEMVINYGTGTSLGVSKGRREALIDEMRAPLARTEDFLSFHAAQLHFHRTDVDKRLTFAINQDIQDFLGDLRDDAQQLRQTNFFRVPTNGAGPAVPMPRFSRLSVLVDENSAFNLVGRMDNSLAIPRATSGGKTGAMKRKAVTSSSEPDATRGRTASTHPSPAASVFIQSMADWKTPSGVCAIAWKGQQCMRDRCPYDHSQQHPRVTNGGKTGEAQRKATTSSSEPDATRGRTASTHTPSSASAFILSMANWKTPSGVCAIAWKGQQCTRDRCPYDHSQQHPRARPPASGRYAFQESPRA